MNKEQVLLAVIGTTTSLFFLPTVLVGIGLLATASIVNNLKKEKNNDYQEK